MSEPYKVEDDVIVGPNLRATDTELYEKLIVLDCGEEKAGTLNTYTLVEMLNSAYRQAREKLFNEMRIERCAHFSHDRYGWPRLLCTECNPGGELP